MDRTVTVVGAGVAGLSAACALAEAGFKVQVVERRPHLGGRAYSFRHPGVGEVIDNCQHVLFGCCTNLTGFYTRIGVADRIRWSREMNLIERGGRRSTIGASRLPAPLHALPSFLAARALDVGDKLALMRGFAALLRPVPADSTESFGAWLAHQRQTPRAIERFWRLVSASALNAEPEAVSLPYAAKVIRELFLFSADSGAMGLSTVPLGELYAGAEEFLRAGGSRISRNTAVESAAWDDPSERWTVATSAGPVVSRFLVLAVPFDALARLVPRLPPAAGTAVLADQLGRHGHEPICSLHLWYDREITPLEHAVLLDGDLHWMFHKSRFQPSRKSAGSYVELVISAARDFARLSSVEAIARGQKALAEYFPEILTRRLTKALFIKEAKATFAVPPGVDAYRPSAVSPWANCWMAGDWTETGWPSTMESAARSGHLAADAVSACLGEPWAAFCPDSEAHGLMRLLRPRAKFAAGHNL